MVFSSASDASDGFYLILDQFGDALCYNSGVYGMSNGYDVGPIVPNRGLR